MALLYISLMANDFRYHSCICHPYILFGELSSLDFKLSVLTISENNYFKYTEHNLFSTEEVIVRNCNYCMGLELPGVFKDC